MSSNMAMSMDSPEKVVTRREFVARLVPAGTPVKIPVGTEAQITQALGGSYSILIQGNLFRVDDQDADAIGKQSQVRQFEARQDGSVDEEQVWEALKSCYDPEIPVNIVDLGLIYECHIERNDARQNIVRIKMTLTAPGCGMGPVLVSDVENKVRQVPNVDDVDVELVFDPPWDRNMLSETAKLQLGMY